MQLDSLPCTKCAFLLSWSVLTQSSVQVLSLNVRFLVLTQPLSNPMQCEDAYTRIQSVNVSYISESSYYYSEPV